MRINNISVKVVSVDLDESLLKVLNVKIKEVAETHLDDTYNNDKTPIGFQK